MEKSTRAYVVLAILASLCSVSCYAHYSWLSVNTGGPSRAEVTSGDHAVVFSEDEKHAAVSVAASIAERLGLRTSWMEGLAPSKPTSDNPFIELALFQGSGANSNLMLTVGVKDDGTVLRFWISDLDHSEQTELVSKLVSALEEELERTFPNRKITVGDGRKLRVFAG